jgi:hypothetical protein
MDAEKAAVPFKKRDADTAVVTGNLSKTRRGEKISPPPSPTIVRTKEARKMTASSKARGMGIILFS